MSLASVKKYLAEHAPDLSITELPGSTASVPEAAKAFGVSEGQIAKTLFLSSGDTRFLLVTAGDARLDNGKYKARFGAKAKLVASAEVEDATGHPVGGVCVFGLTRNWPVFCDLSLRGFQAVLSGGGAPNTGVRVSPERLALLVGATWVDVTATRPRA
jgi:prolyl-tRNA editing enzyme YbaK/EbsC (Cys-tRNA(Pro) deacylase)